MPTYSEELEQQNELLRNKLLQSEIKNDILKEQNEKYRKYTKPWRIELIANHERKISSFFNSSEDYSTRFMLYRFIDSFSARRKKHTEIYVVLSFYDEFVWRIQFVKQLADDLWTMSVVTDRKSSRSIGTAPWKTWKKIFKERAFRPVAISGGKIRG